MNTKCRKSFDFKIWNLKQFCMVHLWRIIQLILFNIIVRVVRILTTRGGVWVSVNIAGWLVGVTVTMLVCLLVVGVLGTRSNTFGVLGGKECTKVKIHAQNYLYVQKGRANGWINFPIILKEVYYCSWFFLYKNLVWIFFI